MYDEPSHREKDALDRARVEIGLALRRYTRRIKDEVEAEIKLTLARDPEANPDAVALDAFHQVAGKWGIIEPKAVLESAS